MSETRVATSKDVTAEAFTALLLEHEELLEALRGLVAAVGAGSACGGWWWAGETAS